MNLLTNIFNCCNPKQNDIQHIKEIEKIIENEVINEKSIKNLDHSYIKLIQENNQEDLEGTNGLYSKSKTHINPIEPNLNKVNQQKKVSLKGKKMNDQFPDLLYLDRILTTKEIKASPIITLEDQSGSIFQTKEIQLNAGGLINPLKTKENGFIFFGKQTSTGNKIDYNISFKNNEEENNLPYLFIICYVKDLNNYAIKFYPDSHIMANIAAIRLSALMEIFILKTEILVFGNIVIHIIPHHEIKGKIDLIDMTNNKEKKSFDHKQKIITIGRDKNCTISFPHYKELSKVQVSLYYSPIKGGWIMKDGSETKTSTNGTWIRGLNTYEIANEMIISLFSHRIKVKC